MVFEYPKPLKVGARSWKRVDSFVLIGQGTHVMYAKDPSGLGNTTYDHISIITGAGPEFRPLNNEFHVTVKAAVDFAMPPPSITFGTVSYPQANLVFYWDFDVSYSPASVSLSTKGNLNAGRLAKMINGALGSQPVPGAGAVSANATLNKLRNNTAGVRGPLNYAKDFWEDLMKAQPVVVKISSNDSNDSLMLDYELTRPGFPSVEGKFDSNGDLTVSLATAGVAPGLCSILPKGHAISALPLDRKGSYVLIGGRYTCTIS